MRSNNVQKWKRDDYLEMLLFFAQRMDELLFHHTIDSYRYPVMSMEYSQANGHSYIYISENGIIKWTRS